MQGFNSKSDASPVTVADYGAQARFCFELLPSRVAVGTCGTSLLGLVRPSHNAVC